MGPTPPSSLDAASAARVRLAKTRFLEERVLPTAIVPDTVVRSWERSRALGLSPRDRTLFRAVATRNETRAIAERERRLIEAVTPEIAHMGATLQQPKTIVFCTDANGILVHTLCDEVASPRVLREPLRVGRSIAESELGTTAPGCVLAERRPMMINGEEHFLSEVSRFACAAAPIFDFDGSLAGVVDVTGVDMVFDAAVASLVEIAAHATEQRLLASGAPGIHLRIHSDPRFLRTPLAGMLALSESGEILGACGSARRVLHDLDGMALLRRLREGDVIALRTKTGGIVHATLDETPRLSSAPSVPARDDRRSRRPCRPSARRARLRAGRPDPDHGRDRHRQGRPRAKAPRRSRAEGSVRRDPLHRAPRRRGGALRRRRRLAPRLDRKARQRRRRHFVPRRDRRHGPPPPGAVAPVPPDAHAEPRRRHEDRPRRLRGHLRDPPRPRGG